MGHRGAQSGVALGLGAVHSEGPGRARPHTRLLRPGPPTYRGGAGCRRWNARGRRQPAPGASGFRFLRDAEGIDFRKHHMFQPTCTICGIESGYTGEGTKTVLPATAKVKLDFRLVPDQRPKDILDKLRNHLDAHGFSDIRINYWDGGKPIPHFHGLAVCPAGFGNGQAGIRQRAPAHAGACGKRPHVLYSGGSGPARSIVRGSFPDDKIHAPNENVRIDYFLKGILHAAAILDEYGRDG